MAAKGIKLNQEFRPAESAHCVDLTRLVSPVVDRKLAKGFTMKFILTSETLCNGLVNAPK